MSRFTAGNHLCWFSRIEEYQNMTVNEVLKKDPAYINWCRSNLRGVRFGMSLTKRIKKAAWEAGIDVEATAKAAKIVNAGGDKILKKFTSKKK